MKRKETEELYDRLAAEQRLKVMLSAGFNIKPTPLKDIPKKTGESRRPRLAKKKV